MPTTAHRAAIAAAVLILAACSAGNAVTESSSSAPPQETSPAQTPSTDYCSELQAQMNTATLSSDRSYAKAVYDRMGCDQYLADNPTPTLQPTSVPTPAPEGNVAKVREVVIAWKPEYSSYVSFQIIVELKNTGTGWAQLHPGQSDYTILDGSGDVVGTGSFTYAFPEFVAPGATAYLEEDGADDGSKVADYVTVDVDGRYDSVDAAPTTFTFSSVKLKADSFGGGLVATGFLTATDDVSDAAVAVVCLDAKGAPLGVTWTNLVQNVTAAKPKGFETVGGTPPLRGSQCVKTFIGAEDTGF